MGCALDTSCLHIIGTEAQQEATEEMHCEVRGRCCAPVRSGAGAGGPGEQATSQDFAGISSQ